MTAPGPLHVRKVSVGDFDNNVYLLRCAETGDVLVIDGAADADRLIAEVGDARVVGIVQTHGHWDHVQALPALVDAWRCPVYAHAGDDYPVPVAAVTDGARIRVGEHTVEILYTPGHTPGSVCVLAGDHLFSGDTLFPGGPGNTDGDAVRFAQVMASLERLFALPDATTVSPGHGLDTTIGRERPDVEAWRARGW